MTAHYLNRDWRYQPAASHASAAAFARRQQQRRREAQEQPKVVESNVKTIGKRRAA